MHFSYINIRKEFYSIYVKRSLNLKGCINEILTKLESAAKIAGGDG